MESTGNHKAIMWLIDYFQTRIWSGNIYYCFYVYNKKYLKVDDFINYY